jgi:hypothetical protein
MSSRATALFLAAVIGLLVLVGLAFAQKGKPAEPVAGKQQVIGQRSGETEETIDPPVEISGPYTHENLAVYLVHGEDRLQGKDLLTLAEALEQKKARILETSQVNELTIENLSPDEEVFVQAGDIIKGGKQDRIILVDIILASKSGKVKVRVFCVEQGRWRQRGAEPVGAFSGSYNIASSSELKLAVRQKADQQEVWSGVAKSQDKLSRNVGVPVASRASATSLQLSLENKELRQQTSQYTTSLSKIAADREDAVGVVIAINGELQSADTYASPRLFKKLWPKLLEAGATEAIAARDEKQQQASLPPIEAVKEFLAATEGKARITDVSRRIKTVERESEGRIMFEVRDAKYDGVPVRRSYMKKETPK